MSDQKRCTKCQTAKPRSEFGRHKGSPDGLAWWCKDCTNSQKRTITVERVARNRANHRARARLAEMFPDEYKRLQAEEYPAALHEALGLKPRQDGKPVRLKPGARREGQTVEARIDVAWCEKCHAYHDSGHTCGTCGSSPEKEVRVIRMAEGQLRFSRKETVVLKP